MTTGPQTTVDARCRWRWLILFWFGKSVRLHVMKSLLVTFLISSATLTAGDVASELPEWKIELPPLSLSDAGKQAHVPKISIGPPLSPDRRETPQQALKQKIIWNMPILVPKEGIDPKILKTPDPSVDFKLIVKSPDTASSK